MNYELKEINPESCDPGFISFGCIFLSRIHCHFDQGSLLPRGEIPYYVRRTPSGHIHIPIHNRNTLSSQQTPPPSYPQPQSSLLALGARSPLVSVDSFGALPALQDSPLGYRFPHSPPTSYLFSSPAKNPLDIPSVPNYNTIDSVPNLFRRERSDMI